MVSNFHVKLALGFCNAADDNYNLCVEIRQDCTLRSEGYPVSVGKLGNLVDYLMLTQKWEIDYGMVSFSNCEVPLVVLVLSQLGDP